MFLYESKGQPLKSLRLLDVGGVAAIVEDDFVIVAALILVAFQERPDLGNHRLGWVNGLTGPAGDGPKLAEVAKIEEGGVGDDLVTVAANPEYVGFGVDLGETLQV